MSVINKRARYEYFITGDRFETGISLLGAEAKAISQGHCDLSQSIVKIIGQEVYLINANIPAASPPKDYNPTRTRKLLLHRREVVTLSVKSKQQKLTLVPLKIYNKGRKFKLAIALGKSKRKFEKKEAIKKKDIEREIARELKS